MRPYRSTHRSSAPAHWKAFTILELLIAVIIIGILVAIIVPVYVSRAAEARLATAQADIEALQQAEQHAGIDTGYFFRLYVLDDMKGGDGVAPDSVTPLDVTDGIRDEQLRTDVPAGKQKKIFIDTDKGDILQTGDALYDRLVQNETNFNWNGPYVNFSRKSLPGETINRPSGLPIDPWGNPYCLFTGKGLVSEPNLDSDAASLISETVTANNGYTYNCKVFDRPTVLSLGPNGAPGDGTDPAAGSVKANFGQDDDIIKQF